MKQNRRITIVCASLLLLLPATVPASTQSSPNYTVNAARIVSGGGSLGTISGENIVESTVGQGVFIPAAKAGSPDFATGPAAMAAIAIAPLIISTLPDGATTASSTLTISGTVRTNPLPKNLTINSNPVAINSDGIFTASIQLSQGNNSISIAAIDQSGIVTNQTRTVTYSPTATPITITSIADTSSVPMSQASVLVGGTAGADVVGMTVSLNGGPPKVVTLRSTSFSVNSEPLASGLNTIVITATTASGGTSSRALTVFRTTASSVLAHTGDINGDGVVDIIDALLSLKVTVGVLQLSAAELIRGDVAPLFNAVPVGDGRIDIEDAFLILRKSVGIGW